MQKVQKEFFEKGSKYLKTLTLKDIAEEVGIHESTVSRSINGKYMQCCKGVFEIKYFFSAGVAGSAGEGISSASRNSLKRSLTKKIKSHRTAIRTWRRCFRKKASRFRAERWQNTGMKCISSPLPNGRDINFGTSPKGLSIYLLT